MNFFSFKNPLFGNNKNNTPTPNSPDSPSFTYTSSMDGLSPDLIDKFNKLGQALNAKSEILSNYKKLFGQLNKIKNDLTGLLKANESNNQLLQDDLNERSKLEDEKNSLQQELNGAINRIDDDVNSNTINKLNDKINALNDEIQDKDQEIARIQSSIGNNDALIAKIEPLLGNIQDYINNKMPITGEDVTQGQKIIDDINTLMQNNARGIQIGGYRYSSSQMRRKSTARRSSSSQRRRNKNKNKQTKKMMLGGKRMKKSKSTKRKNHKKH